MKILSINFIVISLLSTVLLAEQAYNFEMFQVDVIEPKKGVTLQEPLDDQTIYILERIGITDLEDMEVSFGGKYTVITTGCGTMCQASIIIDLQTGKVVDGVTTELGMCYEKDSLLFISNPDIMIYDDEIPEWAYTSFYKITDKGLELLSRTKTGFNGDCEF